MLRNLTIQNYALIEKLEMSPSSHLNVITGETGAGKSIMLGALGLLLGNRADSKALLNDSQKCVVEGTFDVTPYNLQATFEGMDIDYDDECIIRREISTSGKSRSFINDTPATLDVLKQLGQKLVDIHSQNETLNLADNNFQLGVIDHYADATSTRKQYRALFEDYQRKSSAHQKMIEDASQLKKEFDFDSFQLEELQNANLESLDLEKLESDLEILENAEEIKLKFNQGIQILDESEFSVNQNLGTILQEFKSIKDYSEEYNELYERLNSAFIELSDIRKDITILEDKIEIDPEEITLKRGQLDLLQRLLQKHQVSSVEELIELRQDLDLKVSKVSNLDEAIAHAKSAVEDAYREVLKSGEKLSSIRISKFKGFEDLLEELLFSVGMPEAKIKIERKESEPQIHGIDQIAILFSSNKGIAPQLLKNVASGGEFSRLMFCIKHIMAEKSALPTMIFDEIDTGVSGEIALKMIQMMKRMSRNHQIISISHLPQFAAGGDAHYFVYKDNSSERSISKVKKLSSEERIETIAKMISGEKLTESAIESARELLADNV